MPLGQENQGPQTPSRYRTQGNLLGLVVHESGIQDRDGASRNDKTSCLTSKSGNDRVGLGGRREAGWCAIQNKTANSYVIEIAL